MQTNQFFQNNTLSWIFIVLAHWSNSPRVDMSLHSHTLFWFRANQSLLFLLNAACLAEKQHIPISNNHSLYCLIDHCSEENVRCHLWTPDAWYGTLKFFLLELSVAFKIFFFISNAFTFIGIVQSSSRRRIYKSTFLLHET
jgi:hypothetical protein